jgi:hypothetical protein
MATSCTDDFQFNFDENDQHIVIEANLDNLEREQAIRVTRLMNDLGTPNYSSFDVDGIPVEGAEITISDDENNTWSFEPRPPLYDGDKFTGHYINNTFRTKANVQYTITVKVNNKTYAATSLVNDVPDISDLNIRRRQSEVPGKDDQYVPYISFENAPTTDYYMFEVYELGGNEDHNAIRTTSNRRWGFSILSDRFLPNQVKDLMIDDGQSPDGRDFYPGYPGQTVRVYFSSLTQEAFQFYESLIEQFTNDGGVLNPTPASAPSNFNNKAIGFFRLSYTKYADVLVND